MDVQTSAAPGGGEGIIAVQSPADTGTDLSISQAARVLSNARRREPESTPAASSAPPEAPQQAEPELSPEDNAAPAEGQPSGETEAIEPEATPPIEPPRFWTAEAKERFASLPRETQEYIAEREQARDTEVRRSQNEAAEKLKGLTAKEQAAEQARQQYEAALPALLEAMQSQAANDFPDIQSMADVERLAREDFPRYAMWDAHQKKLAAVAQETQAVQHRQAQEVSQRWQEFAGKQDQLMTEQVPELADPERAPKLRESAINVLRDRGFTDTELTELYEGKRGVSLRDHRIQLLVLDAVRWREAQAKAKAATTRPVPPVQRPGASQPRSSAADAEIQALKTKLDKSGSLRDAAALRAAQSRAARRA
jgi:hypothetical protein